MVSTMEGYIRCQIAKSEGKTLKDLDWKKLTDFVEEHKKEVIDVYCYLEGDAEWTADTVYTKEKGWIEENFAYTQSLWATPMALITLNKAEGNRKTTIIEFTDTVEVEED